MPSIFRCDQGACGNQISYHLRIDGCSPRKVVVMAPTEFHLSLLSRELRSDNQYEGSVNEEPKRLPNVYYPMPHAMALHRLHCIWHRRMTFERSLDPSFAPQQRGPGPELHLKRTETCGSQIYYPRIEESPVLTLEGSNDPISPMSPSKHPALQVPHLHILSSPSLSE